MLKLTVIVNKPLDIQGCIGFKDEATQTKVEGGWKYVIKAENADVLDSIIEEMEWQKVQVLGGEGEVEDHEGRKRISYEKCIYEDGSVHPYLSIHLPNE